MTRQQKTVSKILEIKGYTKDQLEAEVRLAQERLDFEAEKLACLEQEYQHTSDDLAAKQAAGTLPVPQIELFYTYLKHLAKQIDQQKSIVALRTSEHAKKMLSMVEAYKEKRLLEILNDKITAEHRKEVSHDEQKEADYQYMTRKNK